MAFEEAVTKSDYDIFFLHIITTLAVNIEIVHKTQSMQAKTVIL